MKLLKITNQIKTKNISKLEGYKEFAQIQCFSNHSKINDEDTKTSYCLNNKGERVKPQSANCGKNGLKLINSENVYQCAGTEYKYYYCNGKLVVTTCYTGKRVNYGMYCDDDSQIENGKCHYVTNVNPEANYSCRAGDKKVEEEQMCIHNYTTEPQKIYKCPQGYFLGTDQKCYLV